MECLFSFYQALAFSFIITGLSSSRKAELHSCYDLHDYEMAAKVDDSLLEYFVDINDELKKTMKDAM